MIRKRLTINAKKVPERVDWGMEAGGGGEAEKKKQNYFFLIPKKP